MVVYAYNLVHVDKMKFFMHFIFVKIFNYICTIYGLYDVTIQMMYINIYCNVNYFLKVAPCLELFFLFYITIDVVLKLIWRWKFYLKMYKYKDLSVFIQVCTCVSYVCTYYNIFCTENYCVCKFFLYIVWQIKGFNSKMPYGFNYRTVAGKL